MEPQVTSLHLEEPQRLGLRAQGSGLSVAVTQSRPLVRIGGADSS